MWDVKEKKLSVSTEFDNIDTITVKISDSGCGIDQKDIDKIFSIFYTTKPSEANKTAKNQPIGNGLGLHTVSSIADKYGIKISVNSEIGKGTEFVFKIPHVLNK